MSSTGMTDLGTYGLLGGLVLLYVFTLLYAYHRRDAYEVVDGGGRAVPEPLGPPDGGFAPGTTTVTCLHCGTENDAAFSFCRACVQRLPSPVRDEDAVHAAFGSGSV